MAPRRRPLRTLLGAALGLSIGVTVGCLEDEDFVGEYAVEVCRMVRDCGRELTLPNADAPLPATAACESLIEAHYDSCGASCNFRRAKARRCLRRLRENECAEDIVTTPEGDPADETIPWVCDDVFSECEGGEDQDQQCTAPRGCSVGGRSGAGASVLWILGLLGLGATRRRRR
jgi:MYXO-CTERM domain-containing protein